MVYTYQSQRPGIASHSSEVFGDPATYLIGSFPRTDTYVKVGENVDLPFLSVVYYDRAAGTIGLAVNGDATKQPYGILTAPVKTGPGESTTISVWRTGHFDMNALNWDPSYATEDDKETAFEGTLSPCVFIGKRVNRGAAEQQLLP